MSQLTPAGFALYIVGVRAGQAECEQLLERIQDTRSDAARTRTEINEVGRRDVLETLNHLYVELDQATAEANYSTTTPSSRTPTRAPSMSAVNTGYPSFSRRPGSVATSSPSPPAGSGWRN